MPSAEEMREFGGEFSEPDFREIERVRDTPPDEWSDPELWESAEIPFDHDEGYEVTDPKHPRHVDAMADLADLREETAR